MTLRNYHFYIANSKQCKYPYLVLTDEEGDNTPLEDYSYKVSKRASNWYEAHYYLVTIFIKNDAYSADILKEESDVDIFLKSFGWELYSGYQLEYTEEALDSIEILPPLNKYMYLVCNKGHNITYVGVESKDKLTIQFIEEDGTEDTIIVEKKDGFIYGNGKTQKEALIAAGYYLKGYLH